MRVNVGLGDNSSVCYRIPAVDPLLSPMTVGNRAPHYQLQASGLISEHSSAGFQSGARLVIDLEESCSTKTNARRFEVPVPTSIIGGPSGTIPLSPARTIMRCPGVSKHCSPVSTYHASGPGCRCAVECMPGMNVASM